MRWRPAAAAAAARSARRRAWSSARPTRTWRSACAARASCRWIAARARCATKRASSRSSASRRRRFPTTWRWSATRPTAIPGLPGWGAKSAAAVLREVRPPRSDPRRLADVGRQRDESGARWRGRWPRERERAFLFRDLATLRTDIPLFDTVDELQWKGPTPAFAPLAARLDTAATLPSITLP